MAPGRLGMRLHKTNKQTNNNKQTKIQTTNKQTNQLLPSAYGRQHGATYLAVGTKTKSGD